MNKFSKVSFQNYYQYMCETGGCNMTELRDVYNDIKLPKRATVCSAGYDFFAPTEIIIPPHDFVKIVTGIRVELDEDVFLMCVPRSGLGFKYGVRLNNTVGIIDSDYFESDNEGHIMAKIYNPHGDFVRIEQGEAFMQGIIIPFCKTIDDCTTDTRNGGFGSTTKIKGEVE